MIAKGLLILFAGAACVFSAGMGLGRWMSPEGSRPRAKAGPLVDARSAYEAGRYSEVRKICQELLRPDPHNVSAMRLLAACARDSGDDEEAVTWWERITSLEPKDAAAWRQLALALHRLGRTMEALSACQMAMSLSPEGDEAMTQLMTRLVTAGMAGPFEHLSHPPQQGGGWNDKREGPKAPDPMDLLRKRNK